MALRKIWITRYSVRWGIIKAYAWIDKSGNALVSDEDDARGKRLRLKPADFEYDWEKAVLRFNVLRKREIRRLRRLLRIVKHSKIRAVQYTTAFACDRA